MRLSLKVVELRLFQKPILLKKAMLVLSLANFQQAAGWSYNIFHKRNDHPWFILMHCIFPWSWLGKDDKQRATFGSKKTTRKKPGWGCEAGSAGSSKDGRCLDLLGQRISYSLVKFFSLVECVGSEPEGKVHWEQDTSHGSQNASATFSADKAKQDCAAVFRWRFPIVVV